MSLKKAKLPSAQLTPKQRLSVDQLCIYAYPQTHLPRPFYSFYVQSSNYFECLRLKQAFSQAQKDLIKTKTNIKQQVKTQKSEKQTSQKKNQIRLSSPRIFNQQKMVHSLSRMISKEGVSITLPLKNECRKHKNIQNLMKKMTQDKQEIKQQKRNMLENELITRQTLFLKRKHLKLKCKIVEQLFSKCERKNSTQNSESNQKSQKSQLQRSSSLVDRPKNFVDLRIYKKKKLTQPIFNFSQNIHENQSKVIDLSKNNSSVINTKKRRMRNLRLKMHREREVINLQQKIGKNAIINSKELFEQGEMGPWIAQQEDVLSQIKFFV